jgi:hypothetical protein
MSRITVRSRSPIAEPTGTYKPRRHEKAGSEGDQRVTQRPSSSGAEADTSEITPLNQSSGRL